MPDPNVSTILRDRVALSITSFDRLYLNGYIPRLQTGGQVVAFCHDILNQPLASPALFGPLRARFMQAVGAFAEQHQVPLVHFRWGQRKDEVAAWYRARFEAAEGWSSSASPRRRPTRSRPPSTAAPTGTSGSRSAASRWRSPRSTSTSRTGPEGRPSSRSAATCRTRCGCA